MERYVIDGKKVQELIITSGLKQGDFANLLGLKEDTFSSMLNQYKYMNENTLNELAGLLKVSKDNLISNRKELLIRNSKKKKNRKDLTKMRNDVKNGNTHKSINNFVRFTMIPYEMKWNHEYFLEELKRNNYTLKSFSETCKVDKSSFNKYKHGDNKISLEKLYKVWKCLNCDVEKLVGISIEDLNTLSDEYIFTKENNTQNVIEDVCLDTANETPLENIDEVRYKSFPDQNVVNNMNIINENLLCLVCDLSKSNNVLIQKMDMLLEENKNLYDRLDKLEVLMINNFAQLQNLEINKKENLIDVEKLINSCTKGSVSEDTYEQYNDKVYAIAKYVAKKKNISYDLFLTEMYNRMKAIYGFSVIELKKEAHTYRTVEGIYKNPLCREIFYNLILDEAAKVK